MRIMDENGKFFGKVSIVDALVVLLVVALAAALVWRFAAPAAQVDRNDATVDFTVMFHGVLESKVEFFHIGDPVYHRGSAQNIGHISGYRIEPAYETVELMDGRAIRAAWPDRVNIYLDVVAVGRATATAIYAAGNFEVTVGSNTHIETRFVSAEGVIHAVSVR